MGKCIWNCCSGLLLVINFIALLAFGAAIGGAIYVKAQSEDLIGFDIDVKYFCIVVGAFIFLLFFTFLGCCGTVKRSQCMLSFFIIILLAFWGASVAGIAYLFGYSEYDNEISMATDAFQKTIPYYNPYAKIPWDWIQSTFACCGSKHWQDWPQVPQSCCNDESEITCDVSQPTGIYTKGCLHQTENGYVSPGSFGFVFRITFWTIPAFLTFILVSAFIVCCRNRKSTEESKNNYQRGNDNDTMIWTTYENASYENPRASAPPVDTDVVHSYRNSYANDPDVHSYRSSMYANSDPTAANDPRHSVQMRPQSYAYRNSRDFSDVNAPLVRPSDLGLQTRPSDYPPAYQDIMNPK